MSNRIREFRNKKGLSQSQFVQAFNKFLNTKELGSITIPTFSRWENSVSSPTEAMWKNLSSVMNTPVLVLKGAYSKDEILNILKKHYKKDRWAVNNKEYTDQDYEISKNVDWIIIYSNILPLDDKPDILDYNDEFNDFEFWKNNFSFVFDNLAIKWLITNPMNATEKDVVDALIDVLKIKSSEVQARVDDEFYLIKEKINDVLESKNKEDYTDGQISLLFNTIDDYIKYLKFQKKRLVVYELSKNSKNQ